MPFLFDNIPRLRSSTVRSSVILLCFQGSTVEKKIDFILFAPPSHDTLQCPITFAHLAILMPFLNFQNLEFMKYTPVLFPFRMQNKQFSHLRPSTRHEHHFEFEFSPQL